jgi:2-keto-3-deoxy-L-rhamnonate aldolase RhmA
MKTTAIDRLRQKLQAREPVYGIWITLESASITEMAVALGLDWVVIDAEHGHLDWQEIVQHIRATVRSNTVALVRIAEDNTSLVKRALDIGADGIVVPGVETAEQLARIIAMATYPPAGNRGIGGERATAWGQALDEHAGEADSRVLVVPLLESVTAYENIDSLLQVEGAELFYFGPADFSATAGHAGQWEGPGVAEMILEMKDKIHAAGKHTGVVTLNLDDLDLRLAQGFQLLALGMDSSLILRSLHEILEHLGRDQQLRTSLTPDPVE